VVLVLLVVSFLKFSLMDIDEIIGRLYELPEHSKALLKACITDVSYPKGHILFKADKIETDVYFIKKGIVRAYANTEDRQVTFWFGKEGDTILSMKSYVDNQKAYEDIELLENSELYKLKTESLRNLFATDIHLANWGRKLAEQELIKTEERLISMQCKTAMERYKELMKANPDLLQRVQLGYLASYLGITQVSLSRIRAEFR
jgi:CRP-like cAMP-binding protein